MSTEGAIPLWKMPEPRLTLAEKDIHIWRANLDLPNMGFEKLYQTLSVEEKMRAERFYFEKDRKHFIAGRGILRTIFGSYLSVDPSRVQFCYGRNGKPALADTFGKDPILFNMADAENLALYAFSRDHEIGVDIEHVHNLPEMDQIAERFFSAREKAAFRALPQSKKKEAFFNCWTRKEAFLKATGDGLYFPLDKFDVSLAPGEAAKLLGIEGDLTEASRWFIQHLDPAPNYVGAFAVKSRMFETKLWRSQVA